MRSVGRATWRYPSARRIHHGMVRTRTAHDLMNATGEIDMRVQGRGSSAGLKLLLLVVAIAIVAFVYVQYLMPR